MLGGLGLKAGKRHTLDEDLFQVVEDSDFRQGVGGSMTRGDFLWVTCSG